MWVMSQDKTRMVEIKNDVEVQSNTIQVLTNSHWTKIGEFKTEGRAKEVLAQIYRVILNGGVAFEMPKETAK